MLPSRWLIFAHSLACIQSLLQAIHLLTYLGCFDTLTPIFPKRARIALLENSSRIAKNRQQALRNQTNSSSNFQETGDNISVPETLLGLVLQHFGPLLIKLLAIALAVRAQRGVVEEYTFLSQTERSCLSHFNQAQRRTAAGNDGTDDIEKPVCSRAFTFIFLRHNGCFLYYTLSNAII
jgi:hypothetical protein